MTLLEKIDKLRTLAEAEAAGKTIQFQTLVSEVWAESSSLIGNVDHYFRNSERYRIKPEPKVRPWTAEEVPVGAVVIAKGGNKWRRIISAVDGSGLWLGTATCHLPFETVFADYTLDDGSPCGTTEPA